VRESFPEYKKTIEQNLMGITYLYDGDVISSVDESYTEAKTNSQTSPKFIINTIVEIYNQSFNNMISKSKEFVIPEESLSALDNILDKITDLGINPLYIFTSKKGAKLFQFIPSQLTNQPRVPKQGVNKPFPEYLYHIDRMMIHLKRSGKLDHLAGLVIGGMTDMKDNAIPFGKTAEEIIIDAVKEFKYPICFNFPAGHIDRNLALVLGKKMELSVSDNETKLN
jgi:hypothetical protein